MAKRQCRRKIALRSVTLTQREHPSPDERQGLLALLRIFADRARAEAPDPEHEDHTTQATTDVDRSPETKDGV